MMSLACHHQSDWPARSDARATSPVRSLSSLCFEFRFCRRRLPWWRHQLFMRAKRGSKPTVAEVIEAINALRNLFILLRGGVAPYS